MGAKKLERTPPKYQPVFMDDEGQLYKTNPEYTKNMAKVQKHPLGMMAYGAGHMSPYKNPKGKKGRDGMPDQFIPISGGLKPTSVESRSGYGKAKSYNPNRKV